MCAVLHITFLAYFEASMFESLTSNQSASQCFQTSFAASWANGCNISPCVKLFYLKSLTDFAYESLRGHPSSAQLSDTVSYINEPSA